MASHHNCYISRLSVLAADREDSKTYQITVENVLGAETHSLDLRVHGRQPRHRGLGLAVLCCSVAESSQVEVVVAVAVGGVLTILTIALIIIYILVTRDSALAWPWCCSTRPQHRQPQGSDISELGR